MGLGLLERTAIELCVAKTIMNVGITFMCKNYIYSYSMLFYIQVNKKFHKFERVYRDCIKRTRDKTRIHCTPHDAPGT